MSKLINCKACNAEIAKSAKACPGCGAKNKKPVYQRVWFWLVIVFVIVPAVAAAGGGGSSGSNANDGKITMAEFNQIQTGMSYAQVVEIVGGEGELLSEVDMGLGAAFVTKMYMWEGTSLGANANVTFQGDKVTMKAQIGLR